MQTVKTVFVILSAGLLTASCCSADSAHNGTINIDPNKNGAAIPESMYGIFFEEINHAGDGGLYAELVQNRGFEDTSVPEGYRVEGDRIYPPSHLHNHLTGATPHRDMSYRWYSDPVPAWSLDDKSAGLAEISLSKEKPLHPATPTSLLVDMTGGKDACIRLMNSGYWGMNLVEGDKYDLRFHTRKDQHYGGAISVKLLSEDGETLAEQEIILSGGADWTEHRLELTPAKTSRKGMLAFDFSGSGRVWLDYVSLFPRKTFMNRPNGLRVDVANILADMQPAFVRWPGGCVVEGISLSNRIKWKETIGDPMTRNAVYDTWGYMTTMGFGYHEFLQFCEDIGAEAMFVCNAGIGCQGRVGDACSDEDLRYFIDDCLDAIEYALGGTETTWGAMRAANGHPEPFPLAYVEIGNENWGEVYAKRYDLFYKAIKPRYPQLTLISTLGLGGQNMHEKVDMIDPHWYVVPDYFFQSADIFDGQPRSGYGIYVGEYACNMGVGSGNMLGALGEAAFLTGMERNSDIVKMASYAPLLENVNDRVWSVNLIWMDSYRVMGRSSYHVQKMFADNRPDYNIGISMTQPELPVEAKGKIGLGSWHTHVEYRDLKVTTPDGKSVTADLSLADSQWNSKAGDWIWDGSVYVQKNYNAKQWTVWEGDDFGQCTIDVKARKISGHEGFQIYFGVENEDGFMMNIGGWGNSKTALEKMNNNGLSMLQGEVPQHIEEGKWYDLRIVVGEGTVEYWCDGEKMLQVNVSRQRRYAIAGFEESTGEIIVKVVNAEAHPFKADINLGNIAVESTGRVIVLKSESCLDENDLDNPDRITPQEKSFSKFSNRFDYTFEPWSLSVLRIKTK